MYILLLTVDAFLDAFDMINTIVAFILAQIDSVDT